MENSGRSPGASLQKRARRLSGDLDCFSHRSLYYVLKLKPQKSFFAVFFSTGAKVADQK